MELSMLRTVDPKRNEHEAEYSDMLLKLIWNLERAGLLSISLKNKQALLPEAPN